MKSHAPPLDNIRYVFLDRDGVVNRKAPEGQYIWRWSDFELLPQVEFAIQALNHSGRRVIVISNQRGIALGLYTSKDVDTLHDQLQQHLAKFDARIDAFYYCPHDVNQCDCRKPKPGLLREAFRDFQDASPLNSIMIGDSVTDIQAAHSISVPAIFITGDDKTQKPGSSLAESLADGVFDSLAEGVRRFL
jgi:D-glycero-D-manno-heptose 1,7-bisphosphate phosphatase